MKQLPITKNSPVLRSDFSNQHTWETICDHIRRPTLDGFQAYVDFIDDPDFEGVTTEQLLTAIPNEYPHSFIVVVDSKAVSDSEHSVLVVNLSDKLGSEIGDEFRALPSAIQGIENNLSIANMDFEEFAEAADDDGVFRGF